MYKLDTQYIGYPPVEVAVAAPATLASLPVNPGTTVQADDVVWGGGEFVFARAGGAIRQFGLCVLTPVFDTTNLVFTQNMTEAPNTTLLGRPVYVAMAAGGLASGAYGWFMTSGLVPINGTATIAADTALGIVAAGQVGALAAGKEIVNARSVVAATATVVKTGASGISGDTRINVPNTAGLYPGGYLSGTGVGAAAIISFVDPLGNYILVTVANTANIVGTSVTQTANNATIFYNLVQLNRAFAQGAIT